jgi:hypothetical protein
MCFRLASKSERVANSRQTTARDEHRESRGAVGSRLLRWRKDSAAKLIIRACCRVNPALGPHRFGADDRCYAIGSVRLGRGGPDLDAPVRLLVAAFAGECATPSATSTSPVGGDLWDESAVVE